MNDFEEELAQARAVYPTHSVTAQQALLMATLMLRFDIAGGTYQEATASGQLDVIRDLDLRAGITQYYFDARRFGPTIDDRVETTVERFVAKLADAGLSPADGAADERILSVLRNRDDIVAELKNVRHRAASQLDRHAVITSLAIALVDRIDAAVD